MSHSRKPESQATIAPQVNALKQQSNDMQAHFAGPSVSAGGSRTANFQAAYNN